MGGGCARAGCPPASRRAMRRHPRAPPAPRRDPLGRREGRRAARLRRESRRDDPAGGGAAPRGSPRALAHRDAVRGRRRGARRARTRAAALRRDPTFERGVRAAGFAAHRRRRGAVRGNRPRRRRRVALPRRGWRVQTRGGDRRRALRRRGAGRARSGVEAGEGGAAGWRERPIDEPRRARAFISPGAASQRQHRARGRLERRVDGGGARALLPRGVRHRRRRR